MTPKRNNLPHYFTKGILCLGFVLTIFAHTSSAQTTDQQLAAQYFQSGEYEKASMYYERIYTNKPNDFYYGYYLECLIQLEQYNVAEKLVKKHIKRFSGNVKYYVDLGDIYIKMGNESKGYQLYDKAVKDLPPNQSVVIQLAKSFIAHSQNDYALKTYHKGQKMLKGSYPFNIDMADLYGTMGNYDEMIRQYLDLLALSDSYKQQVQNALNRNLTFEKDTERNQMLKDQLLRRIQKQPGKIIFADLLIWVYTQQKDFENAFIQVKALDKRENEDGSRVIRLAQMCTTNEAFVVAEKSYQYIIDKGSETNYFYSQAKIELLKVANIRLTGNPMSTEADFASLESKYYATVGELGRSNVTTKLLQELAHLQAYYLHKLDTAKNLLIETINISGIEAHMQANCKLDLGDILVMKGEIWDGSLYYSQVEKKYKFDQLGERAKFKNAQVAYYTGNFKWAKGLLDVLKGSTSKLIANDALELSRLITDNSTVDTTTIPLLLFSQADFLIVQNLTDQALLKYDSINLVYPGHALDDEILYRKYEISYKKMNYVAAAAYLDTLIDRYAYDILADNAIFKLAQLNEYHFKDIDKAKMLYERLLTEFPGSLFVVEARARFRELRGDIIN